MEQFLVKKAYEICYALFRISSHVKRESFARRLEEGGLDILGAAASGEFRKIGAISSVVEHLSRVGSDLGIIHPSNTETIARELSNLNSAIAEFGNAAKAEEAPLEDIFSKFSLSTSESGNRHGIPREQSEAEGQGGSLENGNGLDGFTAGGQRSVVKAAIRQSMILERIRQNGNCRMKEIQEILSDVSERTLRYDLQGLIERGAIKRIGNGGPATTYRVKEGVFS